MVVISDTSPLNYLVLIGQTEVLPKLYGEVVIPQEFNHLVVPSPLAIGLPR